MRIRDSVGRSCHCSLNNTFSEKTRQFFGIAVLEMRGSNVGSGPLSPVDNRQPLSLNALRPCYYGLQILGMWKPQNGKFEFVWRFYRVFVFAIWLACLVAISLLDLVHHGFDKDQIRMGEILNSVPTCLNLLCPLVFTIYYFNRGQFVELVLSVQIVSEEFYGKLRRIAIIYTVVSAFLWCLAASFFIVHWIPFFTKPWQFVVYAVVVVYSTGWWATWLTIYGFVCHVHILEIDHLVEEMKTVECTPISIFQKHSKLQISLERTQKDFNVIISLALAYHVLDMIVFSFAYFSSSFDSSYPLWQYAGGIGFDLVSVIVKLYPPACVAASVHCIVMQASKRSQLGLTLSSTRLPHEEMQLFQFIACCEKDMGFKILGIRITVELAAKLSMTIITAAISFVAFIVPHLK
ncbi:uncharacterized protein [Acropora muricata]|uniref:uncharacterized protein n=1 Tax=Acropora muricata TaxID=159855 RepID=UPI0034E39649